MMYFLLILFFASLFSIIFMIGRKLAVLNHEQALNQEEVLFELPYLKEVKNITVRNVRKHGYTGLVATLRFYIWGTDFLKKKYGEVKIKIADMSRKSSIDYERKEISKFLKIIGDYKNKIREIKRRIKKEENL